MKTEPEELLRMVLQLLNIDSVPRFEQPPSSQNFICFFSLTSELMMSHHSYVRYFYKSPRYKLQVINIRIDMCQNPVF